MRKILSLESLGGIRDKVKGQPAWWKGPSNFLVSTGK